MLRQSQDDLGEIMVKRGGELFDAVEKWARKWAAAGKDVVPDPAGGPAAEGVILDTSWAVWKEPESGQFSKTSDVSYPGDPAAREQAHARVIIVAMNPGSDTSRGDWSNFHHSWTSRDQLLAEACRDTGLQGALMTDLYFTEYESNSSVLDVSGAAAGVERILEIMQTSGETDPLILCLGDKTYKGVSDGLAELRKSRKVPVPDRVSVVKVTHYSGSAAGKHQHKPELYRSIVHGQIAAAGFTELLSPSSSELKKSRLSC